MIRIRFPASPLEHVGFAVSPLLECVLSLHVLTGPQHHALQHDWVRRMRALDPALKRRIDAFAFLYRWHLPDLLVPSPVGRPPEFEEELDRMVALDPEVLVAAFGRPLYDHGGRPEALRSPRAQARMLERATDEGGDAPALAQRLIDDPPAFAGEFRALLEDYWTAAFAEEWDRVEPVVADAIAEAGRTLATAGIWPVLGKLPGRCRVDPDRDELVIDIPHDHDLEVSETSPLLLVPSVFAWPHLRVNCDPPWPLALVYAAPALAREAEPRIPPAELLRVLRALGNDTRLRVLKLIAERPRTTQELVPLVGLSTAGLSKSLQRLAEAGLVSAKRQGYYVVYGLEPARVGAVSSALADFLGTAGKVASSAATRACSKSTSSEPFVRCR